MTDSDYEYIKNRLLRDEYIIESDSEQKRKSRTYFSEAYAYMHQRYTENFTCVPWPGWGVAWDHIRRLTLWSYGVRTQNGLGEDVKKEANERAKKFIDMLVDFSGGSSEG